MTVATPQQQPNIEKKSPYPRGKREYYISPAEQREREKFRALQKSIREARASLDRGEGVPMTPNFFEELRQEAKAQFLKNHK